MKNKLITVEIAGFIIDIKIYPDNLGYYPIDLLNRIKSRYGQFFSSSHRKSDYTIIIRYNLTIDLIRKNIDRKQVTFIYFYHQRQSRRILFTHYNISDFEFDQIVKAILIDIAPGGKALLIHGSAVYDGTNTWIFLGDSGAGKSTIAQLLSKAYKPLSDDMFFLKMVGKLPGLYQLPFLEKNNYPRSRDSYPIGAFFYLKKSSLNRITKLNEENIFMPLLMKQIITSPSSVSANMRMVLGKVTTSYNHYLLEFNTNQSQVVECFSKFSKMQPK